MRDSKDVKYFIYTCNTLSLMNYTYFHFGR